MDKKKEMFLGFPEMGNSLLEKSLTYKDAGDLTPGSNLKCQCGWSGPFLETREVREHNRKGDRLYTLYLCRKSWHILAGIKHDPPITYDEQREAADMRHEK